MKGGKRQGSGRKKGKNIIPPEQKRVQVTITISPETKMKMVNLRNKGIKVGRLIDDFFSTF